MWQTELYFNGCLPSFFLVLFSVGDSHSAGLLRFCLPLQQKGIEFDSNGSPQVPLEIRLQFTKGERLAGAPVPARNFFSSTSLNNIYNFNLSSKAIKILAPLNFIFYFRHKWPPFTTSHQLNGYFNIVGADCGWIRSLF
jgi:hypothetical protein